MLARSLHLAPQNESVYSLLAANLPDVNEPLQIALVRHWLTLFSNSSLLWTLYWRALRAQRTSLISESKQASPNEVTCFVLPEKDEQEGKRGHESPPGLDGSLTDSICKRWVDSPLPTLSEVLGELHARLPWVTEGAELRAMTDFLIDTPGAPKHLGICRYDNATKQLSGWALHLDSIGAVAEIVMRVHQSNGSSPDSLSSVTVTEGRFVADAAVPLLKSAGLSTNDGGFVVQMQGYYERIDIEMLPLTSRPAGSQLNHSMTPLIGSPLAAVEAMPSTAVTTGPEASDFKTFCSDHVDVLIPVYGGAQSTLACIESVLASKAQNETPHDVIVLDDASEDPNLIAQVRQMAQRGQLTLIERTANLGFIRNINRGMTLHSDRDVVWLNADTRVSGNWLDRLRDVAYVDDRVASVTPLSNNGELMSLLGYQVPSDMPDEQAHLQIDACVQALRLPAQEVPCGCGFCFYLKRQALADVGYLDEIELIDGYGEETDWCMRARAHGWRHMAATNLFVSHQGGQSFGSRKTWLARHNNQVIRRRYPLVDRIHDQFRAYDSLQPCREKILAELSRRDINPDLLQASSRAATFATKPLGAGGVVNAELHRDQASLDAVEQLPKASLEWLTHMVCAALVLSPHENHDSAIEQQTIECALITDDLTNDVLVAGWLKFARQLVRVSQQAQASTSSNHAALMSFPPLVIAQNVPGAALLEKTGFAWRIACPAGLPWSQWLALIGVNRQVSLQTLTDESKRSSKGTPIRMRSRARRTAHGPRQVAA